MLDEKTTVEMVKPYTEYLDKEMTIQGVLSAFCAAAAGLFAQNILGAEKETVLRNLQTMCYWYVVATIIALTLAAFMFYAQRSWLALLLGQISLSVTRLADTRPKHADELTAFQWMDNADSWTTWNRYITGLACLAVAGLECLLAMIGVREPLVTDHWLIGALTPIVGIGLYLVLVFRRRTVKESKRKTRAHSRH
jgi:thiosulfate reductase cytochrome b subunit